MSDRLRLATADGLSLEARWATPPQPRAAVVFCHAHPLRGGSMNNPLMISVCLRLVDRGFSVLRFNFRGVGTSTGSHSNGDAELHDIDAARDEAAASGLRVCVAGWSFGAATSLRWLADRGVEMPWAGIAPAPEYLPERVPSGPKRIILGTRDQVIDGEAVIAYASSHSIDVVLTPGDHFFHGRGKRIGDLVAQTFD